MQKNGDKKVYNTVHVRIIIFPKSFENYAYNILQASAFL